MGNEIHIHSDKYHGKPKFDPRCGLCIKNRQRYIKKTQDKKEVMNRENN